jgi:hypothetical protein
VSELNEGQAKQPEYVSRVDAVTLILTSTQYCDGLPVAEQTSQPIKVFLASNPKLREAIVEMLAGGRQ